jgi:hypothetical protein
MINAGPRSPRNATSNFVLSMALAYSDGPAGLALATPGSATTGAATEALKPPRERVHRRAQTRTALVGAE